MKSFFDTSLTLIAANLKTDILHYCYTHVHATAISKLYKYSTLTYTFGTGQPQDNAIATIECQ